MAKKADISDELRRLTLLNAAEHEGQARPQAVLGMYMARHPEAGKKIKEVMAAAKKVVTAVNKLSVEMQRAELQTAGVSTEKPKEKEEARLPPLPHVEGRVVMRFAPNPDGPLSLGRARQALLNFWYAKQNRGEFILRYDDTDPKIKTPIREAYDWILEDLKWLGVTPDVVARASDRLSIYYRHAEDLIKTGKAYVCLCSAENFRELRNKSKACPDREMEVEEQLLRWRDVFKKFKEGEAVVRIKTDLKNKNPAVRDWPALRIVDNPKHPLSDAKVWPLYDFASSIDDHEFGITHVIRGRDFEMSEVKQGFLYNHFGWKYPHNIVTGKLMVKGIKSTSEARKAIESGELKSWDDPRLPTLMAFRLRGFAPEAIAAFIKAAGVTKGDVSVSLENLNAVNRKIIDRKTSRYFFVAKPIEMEVEGAAPQRVEVALHPDDKSRGHRELHFKGRVLVSADDLTLLKPGAELRLKDLFNIKIEVDIKTKKIKGRFLSKELKKGVPIIHWLPAEEKVALTMLMPDASERSGFAEPSILDLPQGTVVQFERVGFAAVAKLNKDAVAYFAHR